MVKEKNISTSIIFYNNRAQNETQLKLSGNSAGATGQTQAGQAGAGTGAATVQHQQPF